MNLIPTRGYWLVIFAGVTLLDPLSPRSGLPPPPTQPTSPAPSVAPLITAASLTRVVGATSTGVQLCIDSCIFKNNGVCNDGSVDADDSFHGFDPLCALGTDCTDCGGPPTAEPTSSPEPSTSAPTSTPPAVLCTETCFFTADGDCDDGGEGSLNSVCSFGTDCTDCGVRPDFPASEPPTPATTQQPTPISEPPTLVPDTSAVPTPLPTAVPTTLLTPTPTRDPTVAPTFQPTALLTSNPTVTPTDIPTPEPTSLPTAMPTPVPTDVPTALPTVAPTALPTATPTAVPTVTPTAVPTATPTAVPTATPTAVPTATPTREPQRLCMDTCFFSNDSWCDDGILPSRSPPSGWDVCDHGTDCLDCGDRWVP